MDISTAAQPAPPAPELPGQLALIPDPLTEVTIDGLARSLGELLGAEDWQAIRLRLILRSRLAAR